MNKEDIKKWLETSAKTSGVCWGCADALNLITEQEKENERLKSENEELSKVVSSKVYDLIDNTKEIADAREAWEQQAKIDVLNELKQQMDNERYNDDTADIIRDIVDELIKEIEK